MVTAITVLSLLLACMAVVFAFAVRIVRRMSDEIKYQEEIIDAKNDALSGYLEAYQEQLDVAADLRHAINMLKNAKKPVGRPKGSKNKVQKPKFDKVKFNEKYGK